MTAVVVVVVVLSAGVILLNNNNGEESQWSVAWEDEYHLEDFVQYQLNPQSNNQTQRYTIVGMSATEIRINVSLTAGNQGSWITYDEYNISKNATFAFGLGMPIDENLHFVGNESIPTKWGQRICKHYSGTEGGGTLTYEYDLWIYAGIVVKTIENGEVWTNGVPWVVILSDCNLSVIV